MTEREICDGLRDYAHEQREALIASVGESDRARGDRLLLAIREAITAIESYDDWKAISILRAELPENRRKHE